MKRSTTVRSLIACGLSLLMAVSMLAGTTFAWFTDSVESGNNQIVAGNLDVELYNGLDTSAPVVNSNTKLFELSENQLWEPGAMVYENLTVANLGTLALKYQLGVNFTNATQNANGDTLAEVLKVAVVEGGIAEGTTREALQQLDSYTSLASFVESGKLEANGTKTYGIVIWWEPSDIDNEFNMNNGATTVMSIDIGVKLFATQAVAETEKDSFDQFYDEDAWMDAMQVLTAEDLQAAINNGNTNIVLMDDIVVDESIVIPAAAATYSLRNATPAVMIDLNGKTISMSEDKLTTTYAFANLGNLVLLDSVGGGSVNSRGIYNGYNVETAEIVPTATITVLNGVYNALGTDGGAAIFNYGSAIIEGGTFTSVGGYSLNNREDASMIIDDATVTGGIYNMSALVIEGGNISTNRGGYTHAIYSNGGSIEINGGNFSGNGNEVINANSDVAIINGGTFEKVGKTSYLLAGSNMVINAGTFNAYSENGVDPAAHPVRPDVTVNGGTFNYKHNNVANGYSAVESNGSYVVLPGANVEEIADGFYFDGKSTYYITTAEGLFAFAASVNKYSNYEYPYKDQTVVLWNDIDLENAEWTPIGDYRFSANRFCGTFDGQGHTISNFKITKKTDKNDSNKSSYGFFGNVEGTVKNLTVANATVSSYAYCGALIGRLNSGLVENCHVVNSTVATSYWQGGIMIGQVNGGSVKDCTVTNSSISGKSALGGISGPVTAENGDILFENCSVKDSAINQVGSFGGNYDKYFGGMFGYLESGDSRIDLNNCTVINTTVKGEMSSKLSGDNDGNIYFNGVKGVTSAEELQAAVKAGGTVVLANNITLSKDIAISNANFVLDGNGYTITGTSTIALFDITGGKATIKNVTFDGIKGGAVVRTVGVEFVADNVTAINCVHTEQQGLFRLLGNTTITNSTFKNNTCTMVITQGFDTNENVDPMTVENCVFEGNTCSGTAVLYYANGSQATINNNVFKNNVVNTTANGATVYLGYKNAVTFTNNVVMGNKFISTGTSARASGGIMTGGTTAVIKNNAFVGNTAENAKGALGGDVCASTYYGDIDLSGNYWGGSAPQMNAQIGDDFGYNNVIVDPYLTTYGE